MVVRKQRSIRQQEVKGVKRIGRKEELNIAIKNISKNLRSGVT